MDKVMLKHLKEVREAFGTRLSLDQLMVLYVLQQAGNAGLSYQDILRETGMAASPLGKFIQKLEGRSLAGVRVQAGTTGRAAFLNYKGMDLMQGVMFNLESSARHYVESNA